ncbi:hypothetical protein SAMN05421759_11024 [Roseivivax lentus]|uniref:Uncharacterized protein n=1 Tax=Roseivivax lentus TaxID=633194 RepID=A0A1N7NSS9_9RHOB|nr:hypothetical protein [Roseivivax lentus]SIT01352.1 hypothetical protein SAMN05421759_11024 [Roseivivax lentus]
MTNLNGQWQAEWKRRLAYFNKEVGNAEKKVKEKNLRQRVFAKFHKAKKPAETELSQLFGKMDEAYRIAQDAPADQAKTAFDNFEKLIKLVGKKASTKVAQLFVTLTDKAVEADMGRAELEQKKKDITNLSRILQNDVDTLITNAHASLVRMRKSRNARGEKDMASAVRSLGDPKVLKTALLSNFKKGLAWHGKANRKPDVEFFNKGINQVCRDVNACIVNLELIYTGNAERRLFQAAKQFTGLYGNRDKKLDPKRGHDFETVIEELADLKKVLMDLGRWGQTIRT